MGSNESNTITERQYLNEIVSNAPFGIVTISDEMKISIINAEAVRLLGFIDQKKSHFKGLPYTKLLVNMSKRGRSFSRKLIEHKEKNELKRIKCNHLTLRLQSRKILHGSLIIIEDITRQTKLEQQLIYQANHDVLTDLINKKKFEERLEAFLKKQKKYHCPGTLIFIDLDRFKPVNDTVGHLAGDQLLINISHIIADSVRKKDTVSRFGGDEFALILKDCLLDEALSIADSIRQNIEKYNFTYQNKSFNVTASLGIAPIGGINYSVKSVVDSADNACSLAKREGRNKVCVAKHEQHEHEQYIYEVNWLPKIKESLKSNFFKLYAQRIQKVEKKELSNHFEILIRMKNKDSGMLLPGSFIPAAERFGLMVKIDRWVIKRVFSCMGPNKSLSINLSGQTVSDSKTFDYIHRQQHNFGINAEQITFEITECAAMHNIKKTIDLIKKLKKKGFTFSLDNFGSGLSSFTFLKNLPVDSLKIDGTLIKDIALDEPSYIMVKFINDIGHLMGIEIVAEKVENERIMNRLRQIGIDFAQGFHIDIPAPFTT